MKRILSLLLTVLLIMGLVPVFSLAAEPATEDENAAMNAEGSNLEFSFDYPDQWEVHYDEDGNPDYMMFVSPDPDSEDESDWGYAYVTVNMTAGQTFRGYYRASAEGVGLDTVYLRIYYESGGYYQIFYSDEDIATSDRIEMGFVASEDGEYKFRIDAGFYNYADDPPRSIDFMGFEVIDDDRTYTISYVDYRTLETFHTEEVKPFAEARRPDGSIAPEHNGFAFDGWDYEGSLSYVTSDMTVYAMYKRVAGFSENVDFSVLNLPQGTEFTNDETYPWTVELVNGIPTLVSGNQEVAWSSSILSIKIPAVEAQHITFEYRVASEEDCDYFFVDINGEEGLEASGDTGWQTCIIPISSDMFSEGALTLDLIYYKDGKLSEYDDCVYVRNIEFTDITVTYTYIDGENGETLKTEDALYGSEPDYPTPPVHEGVIFVGWTESQDGLNMIYTARYLAVLDGAGNIEGGSLSIFENFRVYFEGLAASLYGSASRPCNVATEEGRSYIQVKWDERFDNSNSRYPGVGIDSPDLSSYTNPVLQFDFRIYAGKLTLEYYSSSGDWGELLTLYGCEDDGWQTVRIPLDVGELIGITLMADTVGEIPFSDGALFDLDNICIVEQETEEVEVTIETNDFLLGSDTLTIPKYGYLDPNNYTFVHFESIAFGFTENVRQIASDTTLYLRLLRGDPSAIIEEGVGVEIEYDYYGNDIETLAFDVKTDEQGIAYLDLVSRADAVKGGGSHSLRFRQDNLTTDGSLICMDVKMGEGSSITPGDAYEDEYKYLYIPSADGEWSTLYMDPTYEYSFYVTFCVEYGFAPDVQIKNVRYVQPQSSTLTIVSSLDETEVLGTYEVMDGFPVDLMGYISGYELYSMIPDGYAIADVSSLRSIQIDGDTTVVLPLEAVIDIDEALNAPDKGIEFENSPICQFTVETDGDRLVVVSSEDAASFYDALGYTSWIDTEWLELKKGDVISFEYKLPSISEGMRAYASIFDYNYNDIETRSLVVTDEYRTITWTIPEDGLYVIEFGYAYDYDEELLYSAESIGYELYLDNFKIVPSTDEPVRGVYGQRLSELTLPENFTPVDGDLVLDVLNDGAEVLYTAPEGERIYSSGVAKAEAIILPINLDSGEITVKGISRNGVVSDFALPEGVEWADAQAAITAYATELEIEGKISVEGLNEYNYTYSATPDEEGKIPVKILLTAYPLGDADLNGDIAAADAAVVLRHTVQLITLEGLGLEAGNVVPADPATNSADAAEILRFVVQLIDSF
ncbi:MAG: InlB B-repeat-containing protein [Clostridia bacterium]|nr:InlB B-repeat-containing protein [Clostridia bacterium]